MMRPRDKTSASLSAQDPIASKRSSGSLSKRPGPHRDFDEARRALRGRGNEIFHVLALAAAALLLVAHVTKDSDIASSSEQDRPWPGDSILYDLEFEGPEGDILFHPRVVGEADRPTRFDLWGEFGSECDRPKLRLHLDALAAIDGLDISLDLAIRGLVEHHALRLRIPMNERQTVRIPTDDGGTLAVTLRAFKVGSEAYSAYMETVEQRTLSTS